MSSVVSVATVVAITITRTPSPHGEILIRRSVCDASRIRANSELTTALMRVLGCPPIGALARCRDPRGWAAMSPRGSTLHGGFTVTRTRPRGRRTMPVLLAALGAALLSRAERAGAAQVQYAIGHRSVTRPRRSIRRSAWASARRSSLRTRLAPRRSCAATAPPRPAPSDRPAA